MSPPDRRSAWPTDDLDDSLGDYGDDYFADPAIQNHLAKFQQELIKIEEEINERNKTRTPYEFLLPSKIPQSINI